MSTASNGGIVPRILAGFAVLVMVAGLVGFGWFAWEGQFFLAASVLLASMFPACVLEACGV